MPLKRREVEQALESKGFMRREKAHVFFLYHTREGLKTSVRTTTAHGNSGADIDNQLIAAMARQCEISRVNFERLIDCSLSQEAYENLLIDKGIIEPNAADQ